MKKSNYIIGVVLTLVFSGCGENLTVPKSLNNPNQLY